MKIVHVFNEQGLLLSDKQVSDNYQLGSHESFSLPERVMYSAYYQPVVQKVEASPEEQLAQLALQQAQFQATQQKLNSQLALQVAQLTAKEAK